MLFHACEQRSLFLVSLTSILVNGYLVIFICTLERLTKKQAAELFNNFSQRQTLCGLLTVTFLSLVHRTNLFTEGEGCITSFVPMQQRSTIAHVYKTSYRTSVTFFSWQAGISF
jgi:hypothetical protein